MPISAQLLSYESILLKTYLSIASTGNYTLLIVSGNPTPEELAAKWEEIIKENSKQSGNQAYDAYFQLIKSYSLLVASYIVVRASLMHIAMITDIEVIYDLRKRGYKIDLSAGETAYANSIEAALRKVEGLITRAKMKEKEIQRLYPVSDVPVKSASFDELMVTLNTGLGIIIPDDVTLSRYNEYRKILKAKQKVKTSNGTR